MLLAAGETLEQPGLVSALELVAEEGASSFYTGSLAAALLELVEERGGLITRQDLASYEAGWDEPDEFGYAGLSLLTRAGLSRLADVFPQLPGLRGLSEPERALAFAAALDGDHLPGETTNLVTLDGDGNACVLTTSLGLGSGDFLPGLDLHLNSMLGETDLVRGDLEPGERMGSMMAPSIALDGDGVALAAGAAGGTRLRSALVQVVAGVLDEGLEPQQAVDRPRLHPAAGRVQLEPGFAEETVAALQGVGYEARVWPARHHYFGGVSVVTRTGSAGDPRRSGDSSDLA